MATDLPQMSAGTYSSQTYDANLFAANAVSNLNRYEAGTTLPEAVTRRLVLNAINPPAFQHPPQSQELPVAESATRLVQVFIADPNENIPLDKRLIYSGKQAITDLTDQELFYEIDMKTLLDKHNELRGKTVVKAVKERTEYLEPARIRDLKMTVVTIAKF